MAQITIRKARASDAAGIAHMANALCAEHDQSADTFSEAKVLADGFGDNPAFEVLIAERAGEPLGYALFSDCYNTDKAVRGIWLNDLYVVEAARGQGLGRRLMAAVSRETEARGGHSLWWGVMSANAKARAFYEGLGARDEDARVLELDGEPLRRLASEV